MMILLTGGAACGKSGFAESICTKLPGPRVYIAAMKPWGEDALKKIERHRTMRHGKGFETIERYTDLTGLTLPSGTRTVLFECIANLTANEMFNEDYELTDPYLAVTQGLAKLKTNCENLIVITNDVGSDYRADYSPETLKYIEAIGRINRYAAALADEVYELVCGIPVCIKGDLSKWSES